MYLMESEREAQRLEAKTDPEQVRKRLELVGLAPGMRVLDAGAGSGAVSKVMSEMVGPGGEVVALDKSPRQAEFMADRIQRERLSNMRVVQADLYDAPFSVRSFDLVWCEFVFEYLSEPDRATQVLTSLLRPGGKLVLTDVDGYAQFHYPLPPPVAGGLEILTRALGQNIDPFAGRKLYHRLRRAGLEEIKVHMLPYHFYPGTPPQKEIDHWVLKFQTIRPLGAPAFGNAEAYDRWVVSYLNMLRDPDHFSYSVLFIVEGRRPKDLT